MYSFHSFHRLPEHISTYPLTLEYLRRRKTIPRILSASRIYQPRDPITTEDASSVFVPLFYAGERGALGIWEKNVGMGIVQRRVDEDDRTYHVLEISNLRNNMGTFLSAPKSILHALHITLPHMVMVMKHFRRNFAFEVLIMDSNACRRRFSFATWHHSIFLKRYSFLCQIPLRLDVGWNEIHVNFEDLVWRTYRTTYVETLRIRVYANCKLRQIFFCDNRIANGEVRIPSMRDFSNVCLVPLTFGPRLHPNSFEQGPRMPRRLAYMEPQVELAPSRLEKDLIHWMRKRFSNMTKFRLSLQPYRTYFRELVLEDKQTTYNKITLQLAQKIQIALKAEAKAKPLQIGDESKLSVTSTETQSNPALIWATEVPLSVQGENPSEAITKTRTRSEDIKKGPECEPTLEVASSEQWENSPGVHLDEIQEEKPNQQEPNQEAEIKQIMEVPPSEQGENSLEATTNTRKQPEDIPEEQLNKKAEDGQEGDGLSTVDNNQNIEFNLQRLTSSTDSGQQEPVPKLNSKKN